MTTSRSEDFSDRNVGPVSSWTPSPRDEESREDADHDTSPSGVFDIMALPFASLARLFSRGIYKTGLFGRRLRVYAVAWYVKRQYTNAEEESKKFEDYSPEQNAIWEDVHTRCATLVYEQMIKLEGLWVKLGQMMSTRADVLPLPWIRVLKNLQDSLPPKPYSEVEETLRAAFPHQWPFRSITEKPLATASIAQVHTAVLLNFQKVVVKVQHQNIEAVIEQDLDNAKYLVESLAEEKPQYDFRVLYEEWAAETRKEVDFYQEAVNTETVGRNLQNSKVAHLTGVPEVIRRFSVPRKHLVGLEGFLDNGAAGLTQQQWRRRRKSTTTSSCFGPGPRAVVSSTFSRDVLKVRRSSKITSSSSLISNGGGAGHDARRSSRTSAASSYATALDEDTTTTQTPATTSSSSAASSRTTSGDAEVQLDDFLRGVQDETDISTQQQHEEEDHIVEISTEPTRSVILLEYIEGVKPTEKETLEAWNVDCHKLVEDISAAFAQQIFVDGIFNGDPHPGNLLVEKGTKKPILLDFGLVKRVSPEHRRAFCKLLVSAHEMDLSGIICALGELGVGHESSLAKPGRALKFVRFAFRDAEPGQTWNDQKKKWKPEEEKKDENGEVIIEDEEEISDLEEPEQVRSSPCVVAGVEDLRSKDATDFLCTIEGNGGDTSKNGKSSKTAAVLEKKKAAPDPDAGKNTKEKKEENAAEKKKISDEAMASAGSVIFLLRVIACLRGIAVSLGIGHSYLKSMAPYAKAALRAHADSVMLQSLPLGHVQQEKFLQRQILTQGTSILSKMNTTTTTTTRIIDNDLGKIMSVDKATSLQACVSELNKKLEELYQRGVICGVQVCVFENGRKLIDVACGEKSSTDTDLISPSSVINSFSCSKILPVLLVHIFVDKGWIRSLSDRVSEYWPSFARNGKQNLTIRDVLEHRSGLSQAMPSKFAHMKQGQPLRAMCDFQLMKRWIASACPDKQQLGNEHYHAITYGWLIAGLCEEVYNSQVVAKQASMATTQREPQGNKSRGSSSGRQAFKTYDELVKIFILEPLGLVSRSSEDENSSEVFVHLPKEAAVPPSKASSQNESSWDAGIKKESKQRRPIDIASIGVDPTLLAMTAALGGDLFGSLSGGDGDEKAKVDENKQNQKASTSSTTTATTPVAAPHDPRPAAGASSGEGESPTRSTTAEAARPAAAAGAPPRFSGGFQQGMWMDPRAFNDPSVRQAIVPAANTHFSARALAAVYNAMLPVVDVEGEENKQKEQESGRIISTAYLEKLYSALGDEPTDESPSPGTAESALKAARKRGSILGSTVVGLAQFLTSSTKQKSVKSGKNNNANEFLTSSRKSSFATSAEVVDEDKSSANSEEGFTSGGGLEQQRRPAGDVYPLGLRRLSPQTTIENQERKKQKLIFGYPGLFSNVAVCCPQDRVCIAILVNQIDLQGAASQEILRLLATRFPAAACGRG
ncbi:unnamed protein product [Amoebophrya sp. A120]|nr:unnamed protein product [Amoebophrya sp. A120]|eukprot:GSA120T00003585001.1